MDASLVEVDKVGGKNRLISCKSIQPLKILNPESETAAHIVLSSYGGGMVSGDEVHLRVHGGKNSCIFLSTQSNSRIFKSGGEKPATQTIKGELEENCLTVCIPDPLIPHAGSRFSQRQDWRLKPGSLLLLIDWFASGRSEAGEEFLFTEYSSHVEIYLADKLQVQDRFRFGPEQGKARSAGVFGKYNYFLNGFLAGNENEERFVRLKKFLLSLNPVAESALENAQQGLQNAIFVADEVKTGIVSFRAMALRRLDMETYIRQLSARLSNQKLLGFDPWKRRF